MQKDYCKVILKSGILAVASVLFFEALLVTPFHNLLSEHFGSTNLPAMFFSILFYLILWLLLRKHKTQHHFVPALFLTVGIALLVLISYWYEPWTFDAEERIGLLLVPRRWYMLIVFAGCCLLFGFLTGDQKLCFLRIRRNTHPTIGRSIVIIIAIVLILLSVYHSFLLDSFEKRFAWHHLHAHLNSILNLYWGQAFTGTATSIYGHYAFFYLPLIKLLCAFGMEPMTAYMVVNALLTAGILTIWFVVLCKNVRNRVFQIMGMFTISYMNIAQLTSIYPQMFPHRAIPQTIVILLLCLWYRKEEKRHRINLVGFLICILILIWNIESGLFACLAWSALLCCSELQHGGKKAWLKVLLYLAAIPAVFSAAVLLCGLLNTLAGGGMISVREFVFPLLDQEYMQGILELPLTHFPSAWMTIVFGLFLLLGLGLSDTVFGIDNNRKCDQTAICFSAAVLGLGTSSYAINRPAFINFFIILPLMGLFISVMAEQFSEQRRILFTEKCKTRQSGSEFFCAGLGTVCLLVLCVLTARALINIPYKIVMQRGYHYSEEIDVFLREVDMAVDEDAVAAGGGASNLYAMLGRDPGIYCMDFSDIFITEKTIAEGEKLLGQLDGKSAVFSQDVSEFNIPEAFLDTHVLAAEFQYKDVILYYYLPN